MNVLSSPSDPYADPMRLSSNVRRALHEIGDLSHGASSRENREERWMITPAGSALVTQARQRKAAGSSSTIAGRTAFRTWSRTGLKTSVSRRLKRGKSGSISLLDRSTGGPASTKTSGTMKSSPGAVPSNTGEPRADPDVTLSPLPSGKGCLYGDHDWEPPLLNHRTQENYTPCRRCGCHRPKGDDA